ncbi:DUF4369 domain-containing protein [Oceanihabitans sp. IOP_32]|uniref:DUF4369 domain-containing protein n=1 Tax=Oceanihabitans sp. IOP_32 TaxID=2529032 RepID=UPI001292DD91|nr:DUF4369 domain-containing protein [Oceanihabitans sp. IOP_32]QFZ55023.1 DUF4369 domain-containing protein [Oceanihabitans sp. IOP_32]
MKKLYIFTALLLVISCAKTPDLTVKTNIKGLKKGAVYLKKIKDTTLITLDSVLINGNSSFELHTSLESPEVLYLFLNKNTDEDDAIAFFADKGVTEINTTLKNFVFDAKIKGSNQHSTWEDYKTMIAKLNSRNLDLIKEKFDALKAGDTTKLTLINTESNNLLKRKYLYTVNFAINNKDSEVAPYLALTEIYNANIKLLDTINKVLTPEVKASKYGKELQLFIDNIKETDQNN